MAINPFITDAQATQKIQEAFHELEGQIDGVASGYRGTITIADTPTEDGIYTPIEEGTYTNAGGLEYDPTEGMTYFIRTQGVWTKNVTPINFTPTGVVEEGNTQAVSGGEVFKTLEDVIIISEKIDFQLFKGMWNIEGSPNSSLNWIRTGKITNNGENKYNISGVGVGGTAGTYRIPMWSGDDFIGFIATDGDSFVVELPSECTEFAINVQGATDAGADIPNSPYWDSLKIFKGEYSQTKVKGESIVGDISLPQIDELSGRILDNTQAISRMNSVFINKYHAFDYGLTSGGITHLGTTISQVGYSRTSLTNSLSMINVSDGDVFVYTGEIDVNNRFGVVYKDADMNVLGVEFGIGVYDREPINYPEGTKYIGYSSKGTPVVEKVTLEVLNVESSSIIYIDSNYEGEQDGSLNKPYKSINTAVSENSQGNVTFFLKEGDYRETIPFNLLRSGNFKFTARIGDKVRILGSDRLQDWTKTDGYENVYEVQLSADLVEGSRFGKLVFEDGNPSRPIPELQRHALQKGLSYRLPFTPLYQKTDISDVENNPGSFFIDSDLKMYLHTSNSTNPNENGFNYEVIRRGWSGVLTAKNMQETNISFENIQFYFGNGALVFRGFRNVFRKNVTGIGNTAAGCFQDDTSNIIAYNDETAFCNGDGINGHFSGYSGYQDLTDNRSMSPVAIYFDPWSHDNWDDGMSHHENHRVIVYGGLIEYNDDGGVRASNDSGYTIYNAYSRKNGLVTGAGEGFSVVNPTINENRNGCKMVLYSCFAEGNAYGYASISDSQNILEAINCISRNNVNGELYANYGTVISRNTRASNDDSAKLKVTGNGGVITVLNDDILD